MGEDTVQGRPDQERLDTHLDQTGDRRGRIVGVEGGEHEVTGQRRLDGDLGCLVVTDLTDENDVRVRAQDRAQGGREGQAGLGVDLHLVDPRDPVLDRVLDGDGVNADGGDDVQRCVQGGGLARAGRTRGQDHAVGLDVGRAIALEVLGGEAEVVQRQLGGGVVQDAHHDLLAPHGGQRRHPQIDLLPVVADRHPAVLGDPPLGDVDLGHDLEPGDDTGDHLPGRAVLLLQHTVDAVPHPQVPFGRLDVDVGGAVGDRLGDDQVDEPHDRRFLGHLGQHRQVVRVGVACDARAELGEFVLGPVDLVDLRRDLSLEGDGEGDLAPGQPYQVIAQHQVVRLGDADRHEQPTGAGPADRQDVQPFRVGP